jgi:hypothetical protein
MMEVEPPKQSEATPKSSQAQGPGEQPVQLAPAQHPPVWAQRLLLGIEVSIAIWTGILVMVLPWTHLWTENPLLASWPVLKSILNLTFVRGMISGIGVVDIWMGVSDALHYRDVR